jgi:hypothetical protein
VAGECNATGVDTRGYAPYNFVCMGMSLDIGETTRCDGWVVVGPCVVTARGVLSPSTVRVQGQH